MPLQSHDTTLKRKRHTLAPLPKADRRKLARLAMETDVFEQLPFKWQVVLRMLYGDEPDEPTFAEVAEELDISISTIRNVEYKAIRMLQTLIKQH